MSTTSSAHLADTTASVFLRAVKSEWSRLWTLRSTWWALSVAAGLFLLIGAAASLGYSGSDPAPIWHPAQLAVVPGQFAFVLIPLLAVTGEYSTGAIRSTLQWVPKRGVLLAARLLVPAIFATACSIVVSAITAVLAWSLLGPAAEVVPADIVASLGRVAVVVAFGSVLAAGFGLLLRSTAGTLTAVLLLIAVLPISLGNSGVPFLITVSDLLPGRAIVSTVVVDEVELSAEAIAMTMVAWSIASVIAGGSSLIRRDTK